MPKQHVLDLLARLPQPLAENPEQDHAKICPFFQNRHEISAVQDQELAVGHRHRVRRSLFAVEQRDFAEAFARVHDVEDDFFSLGRNRAHFDGPAQYRHHALSGGAFRKDLAAGRVTLYSRIVQQGVDLVTAQFTEQEMPLEYLPLFLVTRAGHDSPLQGATTPRTEDVRSSFWSPETSAATCRLPASPPPRLPGVHDRLPRRYSSCAICAVWFPNRPRSRRSKDGRSGELGDGPAPTFTRSDACSNPAHSHTCLASASSAQRSNVGLRLVTAISPT